MKILMVNKFLYPRGGAETYVSALGKGLVDRGHQVQYFGMMDPRNTLANEVGAYVSPLDFQDKRSRRFISPLRVVHSWEARQKIRQVLDKFRPDILHVNNIQFHITPSILLEVKDYSRSSGRRVRIIYTAHDFQLICPSHGLFDSDYEMCEKCVEGNFFHCTVNRCIKGSHLKSMMGTIDGYFWQWSSAYDQIDAIICPSRFMKQKLDIQRRFRLKTIYLQNFSTDSELPAVDKGDYVISFGKFCKDKGTLTLLRVCRMLPDTRFVFAGYGPLVDEIKRVPNAEYVGFKTGTELEAFVGAAKCSIYPSECYDNCPLSVIESQMLRTPVVASRIGGIPELVRDGQTGDLFAPGDPQDLKEKLESLLSDQARLHAYTFNCRTVSFATLGSYCDELLKIYEGSSRK